MTGSVIYVGQELILGWACRGGIMSAARQRPLLVSEVQNQRTCSLRMMFVELSTRSIGYLTLDMVIVFRSLSLFVPLICGSSGGCV
jgi:hypothetical protein